MVQLATLEVEISLTQLLTLAAPAEAEQDMHTTAAPRSLLQSDGTIWFGTEQVRARPLCSLSHCHHCLTVTLRGWYCLIVTWQVAASVALPGAVQRSRDSSGGLRNPNHNAADAGGCFSPVPCANQCHPTASRAVLFSSLTLVVSLSVFLVAASYSHQSLSYSSYNFSCSVSLPLVCKIVTLAVSNAHVHESGDF